MPPSPGLHFPFLKDRFFPLFTIHLMKHSPFLFASLCIFLCTLSLNVRALDSVIILEMVNDNCILDKFKDEMDRICCWARVMKGRAAEENISQPEPLKSWKQG